MSLLVIFSTKKDHTCYMLDIACNQGLNKLLPVYLDHILFPLLTVSSILNDSLRLH